MRAQLYDPASGTFAATGSMITARSTHTATLLCDGRVLVVGGYGGDFASGRTTLTSAEVYDPATGTFSPTGGLAASRVYHTATRLCDGRVLVAGGTDANTAELYQ